MMVMLCYSNYVLDSISILGKFQANWLAYGSCIHSLKLPFRFMFLFHDILLSLIALSAKMRQ